MGPVKMAGRDFEVDEEGFLKDPAAWSAEVAMRLAEMEGIAPLTEDHWKVINFLRRHYERYGKPPCIRELRMGTGFDLKRIYDLFPSGPALGAARLAGLPKPCGCL